MNDPTSIEERRTYVMKTGRSYWKGSKRERGTLLDGIEDLADFDEVALSAEIEQQPGTVSRAMRAAGCRL
jgi:hypothetical protein